MVDYAVIGGIERITRTLIGGNKARIYRVRKRRALRTFKTHRAGLAPNYGLLIK